MPMAEISQQAMRARLVGERDRMQTQLAELGLGPDAPLTFDEGFADSSQVTAERGEIEALAGRLRETLEEIQAALDRLDAGTYGIDEVTGEPVAPERLEAVPWARTNVNTAARPRRR